MNKKNIEEYDDGWYGNYYQIAEDILEWIKEYFLNHICYISDRKCELRVIDEPEDELLVYEAILRTRQNVRSDDLLQFQNWLNYNILLDKNFPFYCMVSIIRKRNQIDENVIYIDFYLVDLRNTYDLIVQNFSGFDEQDFEEEEKTKKRILN